jgi:hypothetical protein
MGREEITDVCPIITAPVFDPNHGEIIVFEVRCIENRCKFWVSIGISPEEIQTEPNPIKGVFIEEPGGFTYVESPEGYCQFEVE